MKWELRIPLTVVLVSAILNALLWLTALIFFPRNNPTALLQYSATIGIDFLSGKLTIFLLPAIGFFLMVLNGLIGRSLYPSEPKAAWLLWVSVPVLQIVLVVSILFFISF